MFLGTTREGRLGPRVAQFVQHQLKTKYDLMLLGKHIFRGFKMKSILASKPFSMMLKMAASNVR